MRIFHNSLQLAIFLSITCNALSIPAVPNNDTGNCPAPTGINQRRGVDPTGYDHHQYSDLENADPANVDPEDVDPADVDPADMDPDEVNPDNTEIVNSTPTLVVPVTVYASETHYSTQTYLPATNSLASTSDSEPLMGIITGFAQPTSTLALAGSSKPSGTATSESANAVQPSPSPASPKGSTNQAAAPEQPSMQPPQNQEQPPSQAHSDQGPPSGQILPGQAPPEQAPASQEPPPSQPPPSQMPPSQPQVLTSQIPPQSQVTAFQAPPGISTPSAINKSTGSNDSSLSSKSIGTDHPNIPSRSSFQFSSRSRNTSIPFLRGVNIGNWLILEKWMQPDLFTGATAAAVDQWTFDSTPNAAAALQQHWTTWFTASDAKTLASYGINALRIPIGYWAYDAKDTPFIQGADHYLELAIQWARELNMKVWVDLHGSPGSQNGQDHSGHQGRMLWQQGDNLNRSTAVLVTMAKKYGSAMYADVVVGLEIVNEPAFTGNNSFAVSQQWAADAYRAIKAVVANPNLVIVTHDSFQGPTTFVPLARSLGAAAAFGVDAHNYQLYTDADNALTQAEHIRRVCAWAADLRAAKASMPVYVGEWSALTNVCVHGDGSSTAGTSCSASGCQCVKEDPKGWNARTVEAVRRYVEAQLDVWEGSTDGYFLWSFGGPGGWGLGNLVAAGAMPNPVTERKFPGQCG